MSRITFRGFFLAIAVLIVSAVCVRLGFWQLERLEQRRNTNAELAAAAALEPVNLDSAGIAAILRDPSNYLYRQAVAHGVFDPRGEVLLRGRSHGGRPGVHLIAPFRTPAGVILVNRGWLPSPDAATIDPRPFRLAGPQVLHGSLQAVPPDPSDAAPHVIQLGDTAVQTFRRLDHAALSRSLGVTLPLLYLQIAPNDVPSTGPPIAVPLPEFDEGPHFGYAIQWFSFAAIALFGFLFVAFFHGRGTEKGG